ncbi:MAG: hypothetical protein CJBNEKGG_00666 [Prosthecobacter sp.]|jgi:hypothetical protein|nr:hypothetical protein [Prosthecobacter sp.]
MTTIMAEESPSSLPLPTQVAIYLAGSALVIFITGLLTGSLSHHRPGEETGDMIAFVLCRVISPILAFSSWLAGFVAVLKRPSGPTWSAITVMVLILIFVLLVCYSAWRGTAAFHPIVP